MKSNNTIYHRHFEGWRKSVSDLLEESGLSQHLKGDKIVIIKPNLVSNDPPPITTPVELVESIIEYIQRENQRVEIVVAEGSGSINFETMQIFDQLGYVTMASHKSVRLVDLNEAELVCLKNPSFKRWPEIFLPEIIMENYLISVPVLKAHTLTDVTITMKNMIGVVPPSHYQEGSRWKKSAFHRNPDAAVMDLNRYRTPDFTIVDATVGMRDAHLWGPTCDPPINMLYAGFDSVAVDAFGASLLKRDWKKIGHIRMANGLIGNAGRLNN